MSRLALCGAGVAGPGAEPITVTLIYDDDFTVDRAAPIASNTPFAASGAGNTKLYNPVNASISGGQLLFNGAPDCFVIDAVNPGRARLAGRIHYCKHPIGATSDFQSFIPISLVGESPASNWWALTQGEPGVMFKGGTGAGDIRNVTGSTDGNFQWKGKVTASASYEWAIIERTTGSFTLLRIDEGDWQIITLEKTTTAAAKMHARQISSGVTAIDRLCTANTSFIPAPLVQHSFDSALTPSDGAGQPEDGGDGVAATTVGSVQVSGNSLNMSADGTGMVVWDTGETDAAITVDATIYDGSPCGIVLRYVDSNNYLLVRLNSSADTIEIVEVVAGSETVLVSRAHNPGATDTYNLADGAAIVIKAHIDGNLIRAGHTPGALHDTFESYTTTRFAGSSTHGVMVSKGAAVNSSTATNFAAFAQVQNSLPPMVNT